MPNLTNQNSPWTSTIHDIYISLRDQGPETTIRFINENPHIINTMLTDIVAIIHHHSIEGIRTIITRYPFLIELIERYDNLITSVLPEHDGINIARLLIEHGANVNVKDSDGETPLHFFANNTEISRFLVENNADINIQNGLGETPLCRAAGANNIEIMRLLLEHGADVNAQDDNGDTPLHLAVINNSIEAIGLLLEYNADVNDDILRLNQENIISDEAYDLLLEARDNVNVEDSDGYNPYNDREILGDNSSDSDMSLE
jgi:ankyrin repeat protein